MRVVVLCIAFLLFLTPAQAAEEVSVVQGYPMPVWVLTDSTSNVIAVQLRFAGGVSQDPAGKSGAGVLMTDLIQRGAGSRDAEEFTNHLRDHAITLSADMGRDETVLRMTAPAAYWKEAAQALLDIVRSPHLDPEEIARAKNETLAVLRDQESDPNWRAQRLANGLVYEGSPYALPGSGTVTSVAGLDRSDLLAAHARVFRHSPRGAVFVGAADEETAKRFLSTLTSMPKAPPPKPLDYRRLNQPRNVFHPFEVPQTTLIYVLPGLSRHDPEFPALAVLDALLADGFGSRLMKEFREESGLSYGIGSSLSNPDHGPVWQFDVQVPGDRAEEAADRLRRIIGETAKIRFSEEDVKKARNSLADSLPMGWTSSPSIAGQLTAAQHDGLGPNYLAGWQSRLREVTVQDVQRAALQLTPETKGLMVAVGGSKPSDEWEEVIELPGTK